MAWFNWRNPNLIVGVIVALLFLAGLSVILRTAFHDPEGVTTGAAPSDTSTSQSDADSEAITPASSVGSSSGNGAGGNSNGDSGDGTDHRTVRLGGITLNNRFPEASISDLSSDDHALAESPFCAFLLNETGVPARVTGVSLSTESGKAALDHHCKGARILDEMRLDVKITVDPANAPECGVGVRILPGAGCFIGIRMTKLPDHRSNGILKVTFRAICTSSLPATCRPLSELKPSLNSPVEVIATASYPFNVAAASVTPSTPDESETPTTRGSTGGGNTSGSTPEGDSSTPTSTG